MNSSSLISRDYLINDTISQVKTSRHLFVIRCLSIYALVLIIVGTTGNLLTIIVSLRRQLRRFVTVRYLIFVSICDIISLYGWNLNNFYKFHVSPNQSNIEDISLVHCRVISFMTFFSIHQFFSSFRRMFIDRALNLYWPKWKQIYGRIRYTKYYIIFLTSICLTMNSHVLFLNGYHESSGRVTCYSTSSNPGYIYPQWERVHLVVYNLCPFAIMFICNTYIIFVTVRSSRTQNDSRLAKVPRKSAERYRQFTALLILVTFAFVVLTLPACIYFVFFRNYFVSRTQRSYRYMIQVLLNSIQFTSHGINFFLYCFSAKSFRHELHGMFRELISSCRCKCQWTRKETRQNNYQIQQYIRNLDNAQALHNRPLCPDRDIQMNHYQFKFFSEFKLSGEKNPPNWIS
uniref:GPCR n=1 Tax=Adineta vaga TaxID=104782 RepID=B5AH81_ADIVA|nr:GPCR [Adineta vaga]